MYHYPDESIIGELDRYLLGLLSIGESSTSALNHLPAQKLSKRQYANRPQRGQEQLSCDALQAEPMFTDAFHKYYVNKYRILFI